MSKILFLPYGKMLAHTTRPVEIAKEIAKKQHEIIFAGEGDYMQLTRDEGFKCMPLYTVPVEGPLKRARKGRVKLYSKREAINCYNSEVKLISEIKPDLVITDFRFVASTSCAMCNTPHIAIQNALLTNFYAVPLRAPEHFLPTKIFGSSLVSKWAPYLKDKVLKMDSGPFNKVRKLASMEKFNNCFDAWLGGTATLLADLEQWAPTISRPENVHYIGPVIWEPQKELPHWYHNIRKEIPTIYFTMGSTGHSKYFDLFAEILKDKPYQIIITTAGKTKRTEWPDNFFVTDLAPGGALAKISDVVICQGGNGTIQQALREGTPVIGIPTMHEQEFHMQRVVDLGLGFQLSDVNFKAQDLLDSIDTILNSNKIKQNVNEFSENYNTLKGASTAAKFIENYLN